MNQYDCEDAISRAWLKEAIHNFYYGLKHTPTEEDIQAYIDAAPSVTPKQKTGRFEWVHYDDFPSLGDWVCSECKSVAVECVRKDYMGGIPIYKYCPNCGAKMVEPQESEE